MAACAVLLAWPSGASSEVVHVGSKKFTESVILGEIAAQLCEEAGVAAVHHRELGGTRILFDALVAGEIDVYAEYSGTITEEILAGRGAKDMAQAEEMLEAMGLRVGAPLGFNDTYALGMTRERAGELGIRRISDLAGRPELRLGLSHEFIDRADGWPALSARYGLPHVVRGLDHDVAYRALVEGDVDVTDLYSTDAEIRRYGLVVLEDDLSHFPRYEAVLLWRADLERRAAPAVLALRRLEGRISADEMIAMNAAARIDSVPEARVAADFLERELGVRAVVREEGTASRILRHGREHLALTAVSLLLSIVVAVPLGIAAAKRPRLGHGVLATVGVVQTIPSLALLVMLLPLLGIGAPPAIAALFLYGLLPIVRGTHAGLTGISRHLRDSAEVLALPWWTRLRRIELPLALPSILSGTKTAAVITVGTATLGALIGAGGYGQPILTGIRLDDVSLILQGALPAAALALLVQGGFDLLERVVVPRGLRGC